MLRFLYFDIATNKGGMNDFLFSSDRAIEDIVELEDCYKRLGKSLPENYYIQEYDQESHVLKIRFDSCKTKPTLPKT